MNPALDVCIRGGGVVGRTLALLLARSPLKVGLVDQALSQAATAPILDVRAYALNHRSRQLLESVRAWPGESACSTVQEMIVHGDQADAVVRFRAADFGADALAWVVDVPALEQRLADAVGFQPGIQVLGEPAPAPLTIVCEGRASETRDTLGVRYERHPYGQRALAFRLRCQHGHGQSARQWFGADGSVLGVLPLPTPQVRQVPRSPAKGAADHDAGNFVAVIWSVPDGLAAELESLDDDEWVQRLAAAGGPGFATAYGEVALSSPRASWPLALAKADRWVGQTSPMQAWALAGDAAHTVHPLAGQGLNIGLGDAAALAQCVVGRQGGRDYWRPLHDIKPLRAYERERKAALLAVGTINDGLQRLFARDDAWARRLRNWGMGEFDRAGFVKSWIGREAMGL